MKQQEEEPGEWEGLEKGRAKREGDKQLQREAEKKEKDRVMKDACS